MPFLTLTLWSGWRRWSAPTLSRCVLLSLLLLSAGIRPAAAQTPCTGSTGACVVDVGKPFTVLFEASTGAVLPLGYRLRIDQVQLGPDIPPAAGTVTVPGVIMVTPGQHQLQVSAFNDNGESARASLDLLAVVVPVPDTTPPSPPVHLTATATTTQATLGWEPATDNVAVTSYSVSRGANQLGIVTGLTFSESSLTPATPYSYSVVAYDGAGNASVPALVTVTTLAVPAACMAQGKPYTITIAIQSYSKQVAPGGRGAVQLTLANSFPVTLLQIRLGPQVVGEIPGLELRDITGVGFSVPTIRGTYNLFVTAKDSQGCVTSTTLARPLVVQ